MNEKCPSVSEVTGEFCVKPAGHDGAHTTEPDTDGMALIWGSAVPAGTERVPCPALCGFAIGTLPGETRGIIHNDDESHTVTTADGEEMTMHMAVMVEPHLRAV
ncbi:MAG TPA: hypothetical protein VFH56_16865 [Acidimicrobiales bacterium]|nr:hypothetical protein [Acidimicrobiales bacterium]